MQTKRDFAVDVQELRFCRGERVILDGVNLKIPTGSIVAIMGPSGAGKTTLLHLITGQLTPEKGTIEVNGQCVSKLSHKQLYAFRRGIGVLLQNGALYTDMTVYDNVALPVREHTNLPETLIRRLVLGKLQAVGLRGAAELMPSELSGGMARRVALARAIVLDPKLIFYDEPLTGLDPISLASVMLLIRELNHTLKLTSIIVTHDVNEMSELADYCFLLADYHVVAEGTPDQLRQDQSPGVVQFVNGLADGPVPFHYPAIELERELLQ